MIIFHILKLISEAFFDIECLLKSSSVSDLVTKAKAAKVFIIRLT
jgi:hypothetical protein